MSKNLEAKVLAVSDIVERLQKAHSVVIVKYSGLTVADVTALRAQFRAAGVDYVVLKNTLVRRALHQLNIEGLDDVLTGPSAFAFGMQDPVSPAKLIDAFISKAKAPVLEVKAGLLGTEVLTQEGVANLAKLPSREELLARLLGSLNATVSNFVRVIEALRKKQAGEEA